MTVTMITSRVESFAQFLTAILIFIFVLALAYLATRFAGSYQKTRMAYRNFELIETFRITNGKYLQLVKVGAKYIVLGIGKDSVSMICEVPKEDVQLFSEPTKAADAFKDIMDKAKKRLGKQDDSHEE